MIQTLMNQAKEVQHVAGTFLYEEPGKGFTDVEEWEKVQIHLAHSIECLMRQEGSTPNEEGEAVLAILMGYAVAVRNNRNIAVALERAERVLPRIEDEVLKCHLSVFCYGECFDAGLAQMAHVMISELKRKGKGNEVLLVEELLNNMEESSEG